MKNIYYNIIFLGVQILAAVIVAQSTFAQQKLPDFNAEIYREALQNIVDYSGGKINREEALKILLNYNNKYPALNIGGYRSDTIYTVPEIAFAAFDQTSVSFHFYPEDTFFEDSLLVSFPDSPAWLTGISADSATSLINIGITTNPFIEPRSTPVLIKGIINPGDTVQCTAYILQEGKPQQFILVSPKYQAVAPQGGSTSPFTVTSFNVESWIGVFSETWIHVDTASLTNQSISFLADPNTGNISREATIEIQDMENPDVKDELTIFQFVDTSKYIIATPANGFINSGASPFMVNVNANIIWQVEYSDVPSGMISDSVVNASGVVFNITGNTSPSQRIANISLTGLTFSEVSAQIEIVQSGDAPPYISVSPANSYVGSGAGSITLNVDANVSWETDIFDDPFNMLSLLASTQNTVSFEISANSGTSGRMAEGRIKKLGSQVPADTFRIVQEASFILLTPPETLIPCEGQEYWVYITRYNVDSIVADTTNFFGTVNIFGNDSLKIIIPQNTGTLPLNDIITICSFDNPAICHEHIVFQYACNQSYIVVTPKFHALPYEGGISDAYFVNSSNVSQWNPFFENPVPWITDTIIAENSIRFELAENTGTNSRQATFFIRSNSNPDILDSAVIFQDGGPLPVLLASPREQLVGFEGSDSLNFNINYQNIDNWEVDIASVPEWINLDSAGGNLLSLDVLNNNSPETRQAEISIFASNDPMIKDSVFVFQFAIDDAYILAAPRSDTISHQGNPDLRFKITTSNVLDWEADTLRLDNWIRVNEPHNPDSLSLTIDPNTSAIATRLDTVWLQAVNHPDTNDFVVIYQYAAPVSYLIAAPREQTVSWLGNPALAFVVSSVNSTAWQVDISTVPEWISVEQAGGLILLLNAAPNNSLETRIASIRIFDPNQSDIQDSVRIYQYAKNEQYLLATPREKKFGQFGVEKSDFLVERANIATWQVNPDLLPEWVQLLNSGADTLSVKILENTAFETRQTRINLFATNDPNVHDSVTLFQYAANDTLLLASPRQQLVQFFGNDALEFEITGQNAEAWKVEPASLAEWITINSQGGNLLSLDVAANNSLLFRNNNIVIYDTLNVEVRDSVSVYQLAAPASYILASPRADTVLYSGGSVTFNITAVDLVSAWVVDESTLPPWIQDYNIVNDSTLVFNVQANTSPSTLHTTIRITDAGNILTRDSISVYQYAAPEKYVLVAPREQKIIHNGGELIFEITAVNVDNWGVDILTLPDWVSDFDVIGNLLSLTIEANLSLETRETSIRIFADSAASTLEDFVSVYQYSGLDHYLLASPRERKTGNLADTLYFWVDTVNVSNWQAEVLAGDSLWIETFINGADTLGLIISENMDTVARQGRVKIFSAQFPDAEDIVDIYQYSPFEPFIIIDPSFERFSSLKDSLVIYSFSNLENYTIGQAPNLPNPTWYKLSKLIAHFNDSVTITVDSNDNGYYGRTSYLTFRSIDSSFINYFYFQQRKNSFNFIEISGTVAIEGEDQLPLDSTAIIIETDTIYTNQAGYFNYEVPYGWVGIIRPEKPGYFFDPPNAVFNNQQTESIDTSFTALKIEPDITFNNQGDTLPICKGEQIDNTSANYPTIGISGTFGARGYKWFSEPADPNLITDSTSSPAVQIFAPATTTTYYLVLYNYNTSDTTWFTVLINPPPETRRIEGAHAVCRNQAGVIYSVHDFKPDEYFFWQLYFEGELIDSYTSNIAVIDFQGAAGKYQLKLTTFNNFGCSISNTDTITVSTDEAPPKAAITRKEGDNMLICIDSDAQLYNYEWGWYTLSTSGALNNKYIIPDRHDWYCRLPDNHNFDPITYKYFVSLSFKNGNGCASVSFLDGNAPIGIPEDNGKAYTIFPNPANGVISIKFSALTGNEPVNFQILNTAGQTLFSKSWNKIPSSEAFLIEETQRLQPGLYFFRAEIGGKFYNSKIVVQ